LDLTEDNIDQIKKILSSTMPNLFWLPMRKNNPISLHYVRQYQDYFVPSITLALALEYWNVPVEDVEIVFGFTYSYSRYSDAQFTNRAMGGLIAFCDSPAVFW
jgi:hypothetical protein